MKELVSLPGSRWLTAYVGHHSRSPNKHVPEELNHAGLTSTAAQLFKHSLPVPFSAPEIDIWEHCCGNPIEQQLNKNEDASNLKALVRQTPHWHQSHRCLTSDLSLLHRFNRNDLLPRWLLNTYFQPSKTNMLGFFLHIKQQPPSVAKLLSAISF